MRPSGENVGELLTPARADTRSRVPVRSVCT